MPILVSNARQNQKMSFKRRMDHQREHHQQTHISIIQTRGEVDLWHRGVNIADPEPERPTPSTPQNASFQASIIATLPPSPATAKHGLRSACTITIATLIFNGLIRYRILNRAKVTNTKTKYETSDDELLERLADEIHQPSKDRGLSHNS
ncbi:hypothetical protein CHS0354_033552, partial [Potamilus streckersoni]